MAQQRQTPPAKAKQSAQSAKPEIAQDQFNKLHQLIKPNPDESQWKKVPWMPSSNIWAARKKAAKEGKPILLWYMAGEPLGPC